MSKKTQIEITGIIFMHIMGILGIMAFTFLFLSSLSNVSSRAESLNEETLYYNYGRRLISSSDCFAFKSFDVYFDGATIQSFSRENPGIIDMSKVFDYNHQNCLRYDLVSGSYEQLNDAPDVSYPVIIYEITIEDLVDDTTYFFKNDVYKTVVEAGSIYNVCDSTFCIEGCLPDCSELYSFKEGDLEIKDSKTLGCYTESELNNILLNQGILIGTTCWYNELNKAARIVEPYNDSLEGIEFGCDLPRIGFDVGQSGNVFQTSMDYSVILRYPNSGSQDFVEHPGVFHVKFCQIRIPTKCDSFFENSYYKDGVYVFDFKVIPEESVYQPEWCNSVGLPII